MKFHVTLRGNEWWIISGNFDMEVYDEWHTNRPHYNFRTFYLDYFKEYIDALKPKTRGKRSRARSDDSTSDL